MYSYSCGSLVFNFEIKKIGRYVIYKWIKTRVFSRVCIKKRVGNDIKIPALLSCEGGTSAENGAGKFKRHVILNFPALDFLVRKIKDRESRAKKLYRSLPCMLFSTLEFWWQKLICSDLLPFSMCELWNEWKNMQEKATDVCLDFFYIV